MTELARTKGGAVTSAARSALEVSFRRAMSMLKVVYQPIIDVKTKEPAGYEALMRPGDPSLPNPPAMLDAAEKLGRLHLLGRRVRNLVAGEIERACTHRSIFVNLHPADLADDDLFDPASPLTRRARQVVLELTERASLEGIADVEARLERLRALGYRIAVDDLGAGYAGLSYFARVRPDLVKIDMSLVRSVDSDPVRQRVVSSLVSLATGLGMKVVGEGVETTGERDAMVRLGCHYVQGYALARPGPAFPEPLWA
jgi:EAL domain-containing protein (putative c-di-GMP-specific phosphodiesterase class I)